MGTVVHDRVDDLFPHGTRSPGAQWEQMCHQNEEHQLWCESDVFGEKKADDTEPGQRVLGHLKCDVACQYTTGQKESKLLKTIFNQNIYKFYNESNYSCIIKGKRIKRLS